MSARLLLPLLLLAASAGCRGERQRGPAPAPAPEDGGAREPQPLVDLLTARPLALVYEDEALVVEGAVPEVYPFVDGGWRAGAVVGVRGEPGERGGAGDRRVVLADGVGLVLRLPAAPGPAQLQLFLRPASDLPQQQAVTVLLNERSVSTFPLLSGYQRYRVPIGPDRLREGENRLRLFFRAAGTIGERRSAAALERLTLGPPAPGAAAPAPYEPLPRAGRAATYGLSGDARPALVAERPTRWSYHLVPPAEPGALRLSLAVGAQAPQTLSLRAARDGGPVVELRREEVPPGCWREVELDLSAALGRTGRPEPGAALRLELSLSGPGAIARPRLLGPAPVPAPQGVVAPPRAEHVVVFAVDALRADRLAARRQGAFSRLLRRGAQLQAGATSNFPLPAHASLLTGAYPAVHRLVRAEGRLDRSLPLLPELLARAGFATGLFSGSGYVSERFGLGRGFDVQRNLVREGLPSSSAEVWKLARPWLQAQVKGGRRVFLYLASADPHAPYTPPPGFVAPPAARGHAAAFRGGVSAQHLLQIRKGRLRLSPADRALIEALYDAEVAQSEATLGALLDELQRLGILERTAVALLGTHGEELFDHGSVGHGHSLYDELVSVPLVLSFPPRVPQGKALPLQAELVDLAPTLLHLSGAAVPESMQGESLVPHLGGGLAWPRPALSEHGDLLRALSLGRYKLILSSGDRVQLFDRLRDPGEQRDVSTEHPIALRALRSAFALLHGYERRWQKARMGTAAAPRGDLP